MSDFSWVRSWWFIAVAVCAFGLRAGLASVNRFSNDDHIEVVERLLKEPDRVLTVDDCWQCYQVKLYHRTVAALASVGAPMPKAHLILLGQGLNFVLGMLTLAVLVLALSEFQLRNETRLVVFTLAALNPRLIAIHAQATNDTLVIFAGTVTCWLLSRYLGGAGWRWLGAACVAALVALFSKGSGIFVCLGVMGVLAVRLVASPQTRRTDGGLLLTLALLVGAGLLWGSPYRQHRERRGTPFAINDVRRPVGQLVSAPFTATPSALDVFATFRLFPLLEEPSIKVDGAVVPTSLFTHLYGRALHVRFDQWPRPWRLSEGPPALRRFGKDIGRAELTLGLVPLFLLVIGLFRLGGDARALLQGSRAVETQRAVAMLIMFTALAGMSVVYTWRGPDFSFMKFIYFLPAGLPLVYALGRGFDAGFAAPWARGVLRGVVVAAALLSCVDVSLLIYQLAVR